MNAPAGRSRSIPRPNHGNASPRPVQRCSLQPLGELPAAKASSARRIVDAPGSSRATRSSLSTQRRDHANAKRVGRSSCHPGRTPHVALGASVVTHARHLRAGIGRAVGTLMPSCQRVRCIPVGLGSAGWGRWRGGMAGELGGRPASFTETDIQRVRALKERNEDWGRATIARATGLTESQVRMILKRLALTPS